LPKNKKETDEPEKESEKSAKFLELSDLKGIGDATVKKLETAGINTVEALAFATENKLEELGIKKEAASLIQEARKRLSLGDFITAADLMEQRKNVKMLTTGSKILDALFKGGYETQSVTEIAGEFACGKSQLCFSASVLVQQPFEQGGLEGGVLFVDSEDTFKAQRIVEIAKGRGLDPAPILEHIIYSPAFNSLPASEPVFITNGNDYQRLPIGEVVEGRSEHEIHAFAFNLETGQMGLHKVDKLIKHTVSGRRLYTIQTQYGREITVTGAHSLFLGQRVPYTYDCRKGNMRPFAFPAELLKVGDHIAVPKYLPIPEKNIDRFNLVDSLTPFRQELIIEEQQISLKHTGRHSPVRISSVIEVDEDILWLVGFFLAEGDYTHSQRRVLGIRFTSESKFIKKAQQIIQRKFPEVHTFTYHISLCVRSRLLALVFQQVFKLKAASRGKGAEDRGIPDWIMSLPLKKVKWFLKGFWDGDGYHTHAPKRRIVFLSSSQGLAEGISTLMLRFGILANIYAVKVQVKSNWKQPYRIEASGLSSTDILKLETVSQHLRAPTYADLAFPRIKSIQETVIQAPQTVYDFSVKPNGQSIENFVGGFGAICCHNSDHQIFILDHADKIIRDNNIKLIVVDSVMAHFRSEYIGREMLGERQGKLNQHLHQILRLARGFNAVALVTNQVTANPSGMPYAPQWFATGGNIMGHANALRIQIRKAGANKRVATICDSSWLPWGERPFLINEKGVDDLPPDEKLAKRYATPTSENQTAETSVPVSTPD
jgi:RecA/RadA recombinase/intein/homing endonuclease